MSRSPQPGPPPPVFGRWMVVFGVPPDDREDVLGDLLEGYREQARTRGIRKARLWYLREALAFAGWGVPGRLRALAGMGWTGGRRGWLESTADEVRAALRGLRRAPRFTATAATTLALGIGGTTAVVSVVNSALNPLPEAHADGLVAVLDTFQDGRWWTSAPGHALAWRDGARSLEGIGWAQSGRSVLLRDGETREIRVQRISAGLMELLGVEPRLGRTFHREDERVGAPPVVVLGWELWTRLGGDPSLVGSSLTLDDVGHTVVGVLPPGGAPDFLGAHEVLLPRTITEEEVRSSGRVLQAIARLPPGGTLQQAQEELSAMVAARDGGSGWGVDLVPLQEHITGDVRPSLLLLLGAVLALLLVACVNVVNLLLARGTTRRGELGLRAALGASRIRLARQLLTEALVLAAFGGVLGVLFAFWGIDALLALAPENLPGAEGIRPEPGTLAFAAGASLLSGLFFGLAPILGTGASSGSVPLPDGRRVGTGGDALRSVFVSLETAFVLVLLTAAGLMVASLENLRAVDPGFPIQDRIVVELTLPEGHDPDPQRVALFFDELAGRIRDLPGVAEAGIVSHPPLFGDDWSSYHIVEGRPVRPGEEPIGGMELAGPGYVEALGLPLLAGRTFTTEDLYGARPVVMVDAAMAARYWPGSSPVGGRVRLSKSGPLAAWHEVVGVVGAARYQLDAEPRPRLYLPDGRLPANAPARALLVRPDAGRVEAVERSLTAELRQFAPGVAVGTPVRMEEAARGSLTSERFRTVLVLTFALMGLSLGAVGVYGVVSFTVGRSTREVGVRMALGARRERVLVRVLGQAMCPVAAGLALGVAVFLPLRGFLEPLLFGVDAGDPPILAAVSLLLFSVALASALVPGLRATRIDPARALRSE